jgi:hypothetical protein
MVTMSKNKCTMCNRNKLLSFWYHCCYFTLSETYFIQLETLRISHPSYILNDSDFTFLGRFRKISKNCYELLDFHYLLCNRTHPHPVTLLPTGLGYFRAKPSPVWIPQHFLNIVILHLSAYEDGTECSETSACKIQTPGNYPEESIQLDIHGSVHRRLHSRNTNKTLLCNRIYYSKVYWRLNMFRTARRS